MDTPRLQIKKKTIEILQRFNTVVSMFKTNFHLGLIPLIRTEAGMPEVTLSSLLWV